MGIPTRNANGEIETDSVCIVIPLPVADEPIGMSGRSALSNLPRETRNCVRKAGLHNTIRVEEVPSSNLKVCKTFVPLRTPLGSQRKLAARIPQACGSLTESGIVSGVMP
ncbi:unnamed protein product [Nippostrongylus brasiliensis]|uniref:Transposase n=1 Tax=Nippostrongylus brasiliensis TaxID=27835 RepID=A0A0N4Y0P2_NIPBR|nr:unnamed protein product [Nippostrongylus brasiliensis]